MREPLGNSIPNVFNYKKYLETKKIYYLFTAKQINILDNNVSFLYRIKNFLITKCDQIDSLGYIKSLVLGINEIDDNIYDIYRVKPQNTKPLLQDTEKVELTLITCVNYSRNRLIVKAVQTNEI